MKKFLKILLYTIATLITFAIITILALILKPILTIILFIFEFIIGAGFMLFIASCIVYALVQVFKENKEDK